MRFMVCLFLLGFFAKSQGQFITVNSIVSPNKITEYKNQNLVLIDFWATWCVPCIPATRQLEIIQETYPNDIFIISLSDEKNSKIIEFLKYKPINLLVASDLNGQLFKENEVEGRPYSVLFNKYGQKLWKGKPGDLTFNVLQKFINSESKVKHSKKVLSEVIKENYSIVNEGSIVLDTSLSNSFIVDQNGARHDRKYDYIGTLQNLVSELLNIPIFHIDGTEKSKMILGVKFPNDHKTAYSKEQTLDSVLDILNLTLDVNEIENQPIYSIELENGQMLWDTSQIEWESGSPKFFIGSLTLEGNNITLRELATIMSNSLQKPFFYFGSLDGKYDFNFVYSDYQLMKDELRNTYGISIQTKTSSIKRYSFKSIEQKITQGIE